MVSVAAFFQKRKRPGSNHAPVAISIIAALAIGFLAQRTSSAPWADKDVILMGTRT